MIKLPSETTWILVCDGARARVFANIRPGTGLTEVASAEHPESQQRPREMGTDQPGRTFDSGGQGRHAMEPPVDWQRQEKARFADQLADMLSDAAKADRFDRLVLVAPPRVLGELRKTLDKTAQGRVVGEVDKDLTHLDTNALAPHLSAWVKT